jgi:hypothetical protein
MPTKPNAKTSIRPSPAVEGDPVLAALLDQAPRLKKERLEGWVQGPVLRALHGLHEGVSGAQIADALAALDRVLRDRAKIEPWLGDIANLRQTQFLSELRGMPWATEDGGKVPLDRQASRNRPPAIVSQVRQLRFAFAPDQVENEEPRPARPSAKPKAKS